MIESIFNTQSVSLALYAYACAVIDSDNAKQGEAIGDLFKAIDKVHEENKCALCAHASSPVAIQANGLRDVCYDASYKAGWWKVPIYGEPWSGRKEDIRSYPMNIVKWWISTKIALIHSEVSEALEGVRQDSADAHLPHLLSRDVELADTIIRIMDLCGGLGIDIGQAIVEKLAYNAQRADHKPENREAVGGKAF